MSPAAKGRTLQITTARAYVPLLRPSRYKGAYGGRGSMKSHFFAESVIEQCMLEKGTRVVCIREYQISLQQSVKRLLEDKIKYFGVQDSFNVLNSHIETPGEGIIVFQGMQNHTAESIKSLEGFRIGWVEEAQSLSERSLTLLRPTIRMPGSELWFSWNPRYPTDPVDTLLRGADLPPDAAVVRTSWRDNPFFPDVLRTEMEWDKQHDYEKYEHVWEGEYEKHSESRVFKNFRVQEFETPAKAIFYYGADWGFSVDPAVMVRMFIDGRNLYIDHEVYKIGCEIDHLPELFDGLDDKRAREWTSTADSARPETISYLKRHGYPHMRPAIKGKDSVKEGVIFLQGYNIIIHPRCVHTADEFMHYSYVVDKQTGAITPVLEDKKNHVIDSIRYALEEVRKPRKKATW